EIIEGTLVLYSTGHREVEFNFYPDANLPPFEFDPDQIQRVMTNIMENAIDALKSAESPKVEIITQYDNQLDIVKLRIKDNGCGIESEIRDRIFEPYFSTREAGTGLGL